LQGFSLTSLTSTWTEFSYDGGFVRGGYIVVEDYDSVYIFNVATGVQVATFSYNYLAVGAYDSPYVYVGNYNDTCQLNVQTQTITWCVPFPNPSMCFGTGNTFACDNEDMSPATGSVVSRYSTYGVPNMNVSLSFYTGNAQYFFPVPRSEHAVVAINTNAYTVVAFSFPAGSAADLAALANLTATLSNKPSSWTTTKDPCLWDGVTCVATGTSARVTALQWGSLGLKGTIDLAQLPTAVTTVDLSDNALQGVFDIKTVPASVTSLNLANNGFYGEPLLATRGALTLSTLILDGNNFVGSPDLSVYLRCRPSCTFSIDNNQLCGNGTLWCSTAHSGYSYTGACVMGADPVVDCNAHTWSCPPCGQLNFTQWVCPSASCNPSQCKAFTAPTGTCLPVSGAGGTYSGIITCGGTSLTLQFFTTTDCTGTSQPIALPLDTCSKQKTGSQYLQYTCGATVTNTRTVRSELRAVLLPRHVRL
jgi:hypothetical protein